MKSKFIVLLLSILVSTSACLANDDVKQSPEEQQREADVMSEAF